MTPCGRAWDTSSSHNSCTHPSHSLTIFDYQWQSMCKVVTISDKVCAIWRIGENMKSDYSKTPPALSLSKDHRHHHHCVLQEFSFFHSSYVSTFMYYGSAVFLLRDLWQGTLTSVLYYRGRQNARKDKRDQINNWNLSLCKKNLTIWSWSFLRLSYRLGR